MKARLTSLWFIVPGLLISLGPKTLFPVCPSEGDHIMKCFWTARAEFGVGLLIALSGVFFLVFLTSRIRLGLVISIGAAGVLSLLVPTVLIGTCGMREMQCNKLARPALLILGGLVVVSAVTYIILHFFRQRKSIT